MSAHIPPPTVVDLMPSEYVERTPAVSASGGAQPTSPDSPTSPISKALEAFMTGVGSDGGVGSVAPATGVEGERATLLPSPTASTSKTVKRTSGLRNVQYFHYDEEESDESARVDTVDEGDSDEDEDDDSEDDDESSKRSSYDSNETLGMSSQPLRRRRKPQEDPVQLAFITLILMQNLLSSIYANWAGLLPAASGSAPVAPIRDSSSRAQVDNDQADDDDSDSDDEDDGAVAEPLVLITSVEASAGDVAPVASSSYSNPTTPTLKPLRVLQLQSGQSSKRPRKCRSMSSLEIQHQHANALASLASTAADEEDDIPLGEIASRRVTPGSSSPDQPASRPTIPSRRESLKPFTELSVEASEDEPPRLTRSLSERTFSSPPSTAVAEYYNRARQPQPVKPLIEFVVAPDAAQAPSAGVSLKREGIAERTEVTRVKQHSRKRSRVVAKADTRHDYFGAPAVTPSPASTATRETPSPSPTTVSKRKSMSFKGIPTKLKSRLFNRNSSSSMTTSAGPRVIVPHPQAAVQTPPVDNEDFTWARSHLSEDSDASSDECSNGSGESGRTLGEQLSPLEPVSPFDAQLPTAVTVVKSPVKVEAAPVVAAAAKEGKEDPARMLLLDFFSVDEIREMRGVVRAFDERAPPRNSTPRSPVSVSPVLSNSPPSAAAVAAAAAAAKAVGGVGMGKQEDSMRRLRDRLEERMTGIGRGAEMAPFSLDDVFGMDWSLEKGEAGLLRG
ncbi:hypothetical protein HK101_010132 [Irineochytrium annulatum]|nr:hypothetical protein HK101_010132 [Irineochytrium annulatum]